MRASSPGPMFINDGHFNVTGFISDDAKASHFRSRSRRGINGNHRQLRFLRAVNAFVITKFQPILLSCFASFFFAFCWIDNE